MSARRVRNSRIVLRPRSTAKGFAVIGPMRAIHAQSKLSARREESVASRGGSTRRVDYAGTKLQVIASTTGEILTAELFVAVLGASSLVFCHPRPSSPLAVSATSEPELQRLAFASHTTRYNVS